MTANRAIFACALAAALLCGCASREQRIAESTTRAVYDNDYDAVTKNFSADLSKQVTRAELGQLSDLMHARGDYKGLTETGTEPDGALDFRADFSNGNLTVKMKLDGNGKITGYRVIPSSAPNSST